MAFCSAVPCALDHPGPLNTLVCSKYFTKISKRGTKFQKFHKISKQGTKFQIFTKFLQIFKTGKNFKNFTKFQKGNINFKKIKSCWGRNFFGHKNNPKSTHNHGGRRGQNIFWKLRTNCDFNEEKEGNRLSRTPWPFDFPVLPDHLELPDCHNQPYHTLPTTLTSSNTYYHPDQPNSPNHPSHIR